MNKIPLKQQTPVYRAQLRWQPIAVLLIISMIWGSNMAFVKLAIQDITPLFMAATRSLVAAACLCIWLKVKGLALFPSGVIIFHGIVAGLLFGAEFGLIFVGLKYTLASRGSVILYVAPFVAAIGAHFFLVDDRFNTWKGCGLVLAFGGLVVLFMKKLGTFSFQALPGDILFLIAGAAWGATTVYIKKYLASRAEPRIRRDPIRRRIRVPIVSAHAPVYRRCDGYARTRDRCERSPASIPLSSPRLPNPRSAGSRAVR